MLLPINPSIIRAAINNYTEFASPNRINPVNALNWLTSKTGFLPNRSLIFPVIGLANNWHILNTLTINAIWSLFRPKESPKKGRTGKTILNPNISVNIIINIIRICLLSLGSFEGDTTFSIIRAVIFI